MADNDNNQQNQNQQKNKGGGGGGAKGLSLGASFDASSCKGIDDLKSQALGTAANSFGMIGGMLIAGIAYIGLTSLFKIKPAPAAQIQGGGGGQINPGQLTGAMFNLKKSDPAKFEEIMGKLNPPAPQA